MKQCYNFATISLHVHPISEKRCRSENITLEPLPEGTEAMIIHCIRHAQAIKRSPDIPDERRYLTPRGRKRFRKVARVMREWEIDPDVIWTSPAVRAVQTADILCEKLRFTGELIVTPLLFPLSLTGFHQLLMAHPHVRECVIVGHEPDLSDLMGYLLGFPVQTLPKGGVVSCALSPEHGGGDAHPVRFVNPAGNVITSEKKIRFMLKGEPPFGEEDVLDEE